ncbi:MAG TPA: amidohydrolase family protein, partial [Pseudolysinimonas sp.]|nr:amidohydrolase family protein [Pseudolysinimonas sp.]
MAKKNRSQEHEGDTGEQGPGISRRGLFIGSGAAAAAVTLGAASPAAAASTAAAVSTAVTASGDAPSGSGSTGDLLLVNGRIHLGDAGDTVVSSVRISDGRFVAIGRDADRSNGGTATRIDLRGRTVIPGIIDSHNHIVLVGNRPGYHTLLEDVFTIPDAVARLKAQVPNVPAGQFITTIGPISAMQFAERRLPNLTELSAVNRPVFLEGAQGGVVTNALGKAYFEGKGIAVQADGTLTGSAFGSGAAGQALQALRNDFLTDDSRQRTALGALQYYAGLGITTHSDEGAFHTDQPSGAIFNENKYTMHKPFLALNAAQKLPARLRIDFAEEDMDPSVPQLTARLKDSFPFFGDDMLRTGAIGEWTAGGLTGMGTPVWLQGTRAVAQARWRNENHSLNQTDFKAIIDGWVQVNQEFPITDLRWVVAHVPFITAEYIQKLKALGGGLKVGWGPVRTGTLQGPPYRTIVSSGIPTGYHSDGGDITVINPWLNLYTIVTGKNLQGDVINAGQTLS